jgi:hypothetical protein
MGVVDREVGEASTSTATAETVPSIAGSPGIPINVEINENRSLLNWGDYKPPMLKTPVHKKLKVSTKTSEIHRENVALKGTTRINTSRRRPLTQTLHSSKISEVYEQLAHEKLNLVRRQQEHAEVEHKKRLLEMQLKQKILQIELEIKTKELAQLRQ